MKAQPGKNLFLIGGSGIISTFMGLNLIDEYRIRVNPVVMGGGKPLIKGFKERLHLELLDTKTYKSGVVGLHYQQL